MQNAIQSQNGVTNKYKNNPSQRYPGASGKKPGRKHSYIEKKTVTGGTPVPAADKHGHLNASVQQNLAQGPMPYKALPVHSKAELPGLQPTQQAHGYTNLVQVQHSKASISKTSMGTMQSRMGTNAATPANLHQAHPGALSHLEYDGHVVAADEARHSAQGPYPHSLMQAPHAFHGALVREGTADKVALQEMPGGNNFYHLQSSTYSSKKPPINQNMKGGTSAAYRGPGFS